MATVVFIALLFFTFWFTKSRRKAGAGIWIFLNGCLNSAGPAILFFGIYFGIHYYLLVFPAILLLIFNKKGEHRSFFILSAVAITLFIYIHYFFTDPLLPILRNEREFEILNVVNIITPIIMILIVLFIFSLNLNKARDELEKLHAKANELLLNILPESIADRLKNKENNIADSFSEATILFADFKGFTQFAAKCEPKELVSVLNRYFTAYDILCGKYGVEKIKTIGDSYMAATGIPIANENHAYVMAQFACDMLKTTQKVSRQLKTSLELRIGINSGVVVAGVIGQRKFIYDLWGDAVNLASRMESHGIPGKIQTTTATYHLLKNDFDFKKRGKIDVKSKGIQETYFLIGKKR
ncbi:MAG: adenylate/guanylate cyclase domain-containing protein [Leptospirales bacterium]